MVKIWLLGLNIIKILNLQRSEKRIKILPRGLWAKTDAASVCVSTDVAKKCYFAGKASVFTHMAGRYILYPCTSKPPAKTGWRDMAHFLPRSKKLFRRNRRPLVVILCSLTATRNFWESWGYIPPPPTEKTLLHCLVHSWLQNHTSHSRR